MHALPIFGAAFQCLKYEHEFLSHYYSKMNLALHLEASGTRVAPQHWISILQGSNYVNTIKNALSVL